MADSTHDRTVTLILTPKSPSAHPTKTFDLSHSNNSSNNNAVTIGRSTGPPTAPSSSNEFYTSYAMSRKHATISATADPATREPEVFVRDLGTLNGTFVNGRRLEIPELGRESEGVRVRDGDEVRFARDVEEAEGDGGRYEGVEVVVGVTVD